MIITIITNIHITTFATFSFTPNHSKKSFIYIASIILLLFIFFAQKKRKLLFFYCFLPLFSAFPIFSQFSSFFYYSATKKQIFQPVFLLFVNFADLNLLVPDLMFQASAKPFAVRLFLSNTNHI